jgi:hypothetical protein
LLGEAVPTRDQLIKLQDEPDRPQISYQLVVAYEAIRFRESRVPARNPDLVA